MLRHRKRPTVMPERASYGPARACAGDQTSERPIGSTPKLGAEPRVWTARMLAALDKGVKGGKWYSLIDKVYPEAALRSAFTQVAANRGAAGVDHVTIAKYASDLDANLARLSEALRSGTYRPQHIRRHYIPKPGSQEKRPLGIPTVQDRVVQTALRTVLEPIFERDFAPHSYGFRPGRGCKSLPSRKRGTHCGGSMACSKPATSTSSTPTPAFAGAGSEELFRHASQRPPSRPDRAEGVGRSPSRAGRGVP